ncbi:hypothetical protein QO002_004662 [Pararhizobium capsulatum DSM 1112]|uniref:Integrase catalytic domain-containing protein n=1 Tax=Pararhizobium capsulatum DSM 1112 TaxID=1121113 RepID=A0ABU0BW25_9HYPH|nr:hypothetical protein [Pararhizobium capsulatum DSM 1112]
MGLIAMSERDLQRIEVLSKVVDGHMTLDAKGGQGMTQFGRALCELNIEILCANSSQAKGRVERMNRTLQDRLVKALRLAGIDNMKAGNAFLSSSWTVTMRDFQSSLPDPMICTGR